MSNSLNRLKAKVKAVNNANAFANDLQQQLIAIFTPLIGKAILKADGSLFASVKKLVPDVPYTTGLHVYLNTSSHSLAWVVKTCESIEGTCTCLYHETSVYVGSLNGNTLVSVNAPSEYRADYKVEDILEARRVYAEAKRIADEAHSAHSALHPFGE